MKLSMKFSNNGFEAHGPSAGRIVISPKLGRKKRLRDSELPAYFPCQCNGFKESYGAKSCIFFQIF
jgi:hypothetical protein